MPSPKEVFENPLKFIEFLTSASDDRFEGQHFDRKEACRADEHGNISSSKINRIREHITETISAFANKNKEGGLLVLGKEENEERYAIHRLLAKVRQFEKPLKERKEWHQKIVRNMVNWFRERKDEFEFLNEFEAETIHLQQWQSQSFDILPIETVYLIDFEAYPLWHRGNYEESKILLENALNLYLENQLNDEKLLSNLYNDLGVFTGNIGNIRQSFEFKQKALSIGRTVFNENSEDIAKFLSNLGNTYRELGNYQKALELEQKAFEIRRELFGENHPDVAMSLNNLGNTYRELGNYQKALELNGQALKIQQELFGVKHSDIAQSLSNLGLTYNYLGNHQKALELHEQALKMQQELLGEKHPDTISSCRNLIQTLSELGKREQAGRLAGEFLSYVPQNHPDRKLFEKYGAVYRKSSKKKQRRHN